MNYVNNVMLDNNYAHSNNLPYERMQNFNSYNSNSQPNLNDSFLSRRGNEFINSNPYQNNQNLNSFNQNMDELVRSNLKSRGVNQRDYNFSPSGKFNAENSDRKKMLLSNIQQQMLLSKNTKLSELERKRKEDEKYLRDSENSYPFGRGGAGAPIRDKWGNVVTSRRALISDPKYHYANVNVEDDYQETTRRNDSNLNMYNKGMNGMNSQFNNQSSYNSNQYNPYNYQNERDFAFNLNQRAHSVRNANIGESNPIPNLHSQFNNNQNYYNNPNGMNRVQSSHHFNNSNVYDQAPYNQPNEIPNNMNLNYQENPNESYLNNNRNNYQQLNNFGNQNTNNIPLNYPQLNNMQNNKTQFDPNLIPNFPVDEPNGGNYSNSNNKFSTNEIDDDPKKKGKQDYGNYLRNQMEMDKRKKEIEKELKKKEEWEEEMRIKREMEELKLLDEKEKEKKKQDLDKLQTENQAIRENYVMTKRKKVNFADDNSTNKQNDQQNFNNVSNYNNQNSNFEQPNLNQNSFQNDSNYHPNIPNKEDIELKQNINNEILKLRTNIVDQQSVLLKQINELKTETHNANLQRYEVLKEFSNLKEEISKQRIDEEMRRKYVYDVLVDNGNKINTTAANTKLPDLRQEDFKVELPKPKNHSKNLKDMYYDDTIKYPNRLQAIPNLNEFKENNFKSESKFIDIDSHNVLDNLNIYKEESGVASKGIELDEDFGALTSYFKDDKKINERNSSDNMDEYFYEQKRDYENISNKNKNIFGFPKRQESTPVVKTPNSGNKFNDYVDQDLEYNKQVINEDSLSINQIYNKNLERLRNLNKLEENLYLDKLDDHKDFLNKINDLKY